MKQLSPMRQKILDYISAYTDDNGYPPSVREICQAVGLRRHYPQIQYRRD